MKSVLIQLTLLSLLYVTYEQKITSCNKEAEGNFDLNAAKLYIYGDEERLYPTNRDDLKDFLESGRLHDWIKNYSNKCLTKLSRQVISLMMYSIGKHNTNICKSRRRATEFLQAANCGNVAKKETTKCWNNWINELDGIKLHETINLRIPLMCCTFYRYRACNQGSYEKQTKACDQKAIDGQEKLLNSYAAETLGLLCGDWPEDSDKCEKIIHDIPKSREKKLAKSPAKVFIQIFDSIPD